MEFIDEVRTTVPTEDGRIKHYFTHNYRNNDGEIVTDSVTILQNTDPDEYSLLTVENKALPSMNAQDWIRHDEAEYFAKFDKAIDAFIYQPLP